MLASYNSFLLRRFATAYATGNPVRWLAEVQLQSLPFGILFIVILFVGWALGARGMGFFWLWLIDFAIAIAGWTYVIVMARRASRPRG